MSLEISELVGEWARVLHRMKTKELVKKDVIEALRSDEPIPPKARILVADVLEGKYKFKTGAKGRSAFNIQILLLIFSHAEQWGKRIQHGVLPNRLGMLVLVEGEALEQARNSLAAGAPPREVALDLVAEFAGVSSRQIEKYIAEDRER